MRGSGLWALSNLTASQILRWPSQKLFPHLESNAIRFAFTIEGPVEVEHFQRAVRKLVQNSDALRMTFEEVDMAPRWRIVAEPRLEVPHVKAEGPDPVAAYREWIDRVRKRPISVEAPFECALYEINPSRFVWYLGFHHMIGDLRAALLMTQMIVKYYELSREGKLDDAPRLPSFQDYVEFERQSRTTDAYSKSDEYWKKKLKDSRRVRREEAFGQPELKDTTVDRTLLPIGRERTEKLLALAKRERYFSPAIPFSMLLFVFQADYMGGGTALPSKIGANFGNRPPRFLDTIGLFVVTCPLSIVVEREETFKSLANKVHLETVRASLHQHFPVHSTAAAFTTLFNYMNVNFPASFAGHKMKAERIRSGHSNIPFMFHVHDLDGEGQFTFDFEFQRAEFGLTRQREIVQFLDKLLDVFLNDPERSIFGNR